MNQSELAKKLKVSQAAVSKYVRDGKIVKGVKKKGRNYIFDIKIVRKELAGNLDPSYAKTNSPKKSAKKKGAPKKKSIVKKSKKTKIAAKKKQGAPEDPAGDDEKNKSKLTETITTHKTKKEKFSAKLEEVKYKKEIGILVEKAEVAIIGAKAARIFRDALLNVGPKIASAILFRVMEILPDDMKKLLSAKFDERGVVEILHKEHSQVLDDIVTSLEKL